MTDPPPSAVLLSPIARKPQRAPAFVDSPSSSTDSLPLPASSADSGRRDDQSQLLNPSSSSGASASVSARNALRVSAVFDKLASLLPPTVQNFVEQNVGLMFVASAQIFFVAMALTVKYFVSTTSISTSTLILVRMSITGVLCSLTLKFYLKDPNPFFGPKGIRAKLAMRGFIGWFGLAGNYNSLRGLSVSDSVTIQFLTPSVTALLGFLFLKEKTSRREVVAGFCCLAGVVLVSRPPFIFGSHTGLIARPSPGDAAGGEGGTRLDLPPAPFPGEGDGAGIRTQDRLVSVAWALSSTVGSAGAYCTIRSIGNRASPLHSIGYFSYMCTITSILGIIIDPAPIAWVGNLHGNAVILAIGVFGFVGQTLLTMGLQREKAGRAGLAMYLQVVVALVVEFCLWHTIPSFLSILGTAIILVSAFWAALSTTKPLGQAKPTDPEAQPFSRTPTPIPPPQSDRPPLRGQHYSYDSVGPEEPRAESPDGGENDVTTSLLKSDANSYAFKEATASATATDGRLEVPRHTVSRRSSALSSSSSGSGGAGSHSPR